ncbi:DUF3558 domain-containing protein, partial [Nocardia sp. NPDC058497]|uniref:DUF3558 domain-containing protein n=1 Tax=Nocardia sp. NPDC058497 TaxID=3346529 RepID=UPI00365D32CF
TALLGSALTLAACSPITPPEQAEPSASTAPSVAIAAPVPSAPTQPPSKRQPVEFDPCTHIDDAIPISMGFDPATRKRVDFVFDDYAFIGCEFRRLDNVRGQQLEVGTLGISSTNVTLDEMRARNYEGARPTSVSGREALFHRTRAAESCYIAMPGPDATIEVRISSIYALTDWVGCDHIDEAASTVEAVLPSQ